MKETTALLCLLAALIGIGSSSPVPGPVCLKAVAPPTAFVGVNQLSTNSDKPRFRLQFTEHTVDKGRRDAKQSYRVHVTAMDPRVAYSDAKVSMETTGSCGVGTLKYESDDFFQARQQNESCPELYLTSRKTSMTDLPLLLWTPPDCGCVLFRALVIENGTEYFAEQEGVQKGHLAQLICVNRATREQHLNALCHVIDRYLIKEIINSDAFLSSRGLKDKVVDRYELDLGLKLRRSDARICCTKASLAERSECFEEIKLRRIDSFCADGEPDIPFTEYRKVHMKKKDRECCYIFGEFRYECFIRGDRGGQAIHGMSPLDYSLDEMDPANDVSVFASEKDKDIVSLLSPLSFDMGINTGVKPVVKQVQNARDVAVIDNDPQVDEDDDDEEEDDDKEQTKKAAKGSAKHSKKHHKGIEVDDVLARRGGIDIPTAKTPSNDFITSARHGLSSFPSSSLPTDPSRGIPTEETLTSAEIRRLKMLSRELYKSPLPTDVLDERTSKRLTSAERRTGMRLGSERISGRRTSAERFANRHSSRELPGGLPDEDWALGHLSPYNSQYPVSPPGGRSLRRQSKSEKITSLSKNVQYSLSRRLSSAARRKEHGVQHGFDDQGRASAGRTLSKLERKIQRLHLKQQCCRSGASAGEFVFGGFTQAWNECTHSGEKWVKRKAFRSGHKVCREQFKKCCVESSISGTTMTSQEFRDAEDVYLNNLERLSSSEAGALLARGQSAAASNRRPVLSADLGPVAMEAAGGQDKAGADLFDGMRDLPEDEDIYDEDYNGPSRFDEIDNEMASQLGGLDRGQTRKDKEEEEERNMKQLRRQQMEEEDDESESDDDDQDEDDEDEDEEFERDLGIVDVETVDGKEIPRKSSSQNRTESSTNNPKTSSSSQISVKKETKDEKKAQGESEVRKNPSHKKVITDKLAKKSNANTATDFDAQALALLSRQGFETSPARPSYNSSKTRRRKKHRGSSRRGGRSRSRSREGRRRSSSSRRSRKGSKERRHRGGRQYRSRQTAQYVPYKGGAKDSHEMAALNAQRMAGAMDSKEMADVYTHGTFARMMRDRAFRRHYRG